MAEQSSGATAQHSNCFAALYAAAGWAADSRGKEMQANALAAEGQVGIELKEFGTSWTIHLSPGAQYVSHPRSFQSSWMSKKTLEGMIAAARASINKTLGSMQESYNQNEASMWSNYRHAQSSPEYAGQYYSAEAACESRMRQLSQQMDPYNRERAAGGNLSTVSEINAAWDALMGGSFTGDPVNKAPFKAYLSHTRVSVTIPMYENHIASLIRAQASGTVIMAAQAILNETKTKQTDATTAAQQGVQQAQNAVSQDGNMGKLEIELVKQVNATLLACSVGRGIRG